MTATTEAARVESLAGELMGLTASIRRTVRRQVERTLPGPTLPTAQIDLLLVVEGEPGIGVAGAAHTLHLAGNSVSALVNQLVSAGLLRRETDPADRRAARLLLTVEAAGRLARWRAARAMIVGGALERVGAADRAAIAEAVPALARLLTELRTTERST